MGEALDSTYNGDQTGRLFIALVTRRRRPLFIEAEVRERVEAAVRAAGEAARCRVVCCEVWPAEVRVCVELSPGATAGGLVSQVRTTAASVLADEGRQANGVFARRVMVTAKPTAETACVGEDYPAGSSPFETDDLR